MTKALLLDQIDIDGPVTDRGLPSLAAESLHDVLLAVWWEASRMRAAIHRLVGGHRCDVVLVAGTLRLGAGPAGANGARLSVDGDCTCRDYLVDLLVESDRFLVRTHGTLTNPPGAVRQHIRLRANADWGRGRRLAMGAQARADRIRAGVRARQLPDDFHRAVLEYLVDEAGSLASLEDDDQLHRRLAERAAAEFGGDAAKLLPLVRSAIPVVEAACRTGARSDPGDGSMVTWWERYVERPLGRRVRRGDAELDRSADLPCAVAGQAFDEVDDPSAGRAPLDALLTAAGRGASRLELAPLLFGAVVTLTAEGQVPPAVAARFLGDQQRFDAALADLLDVAC